MNGESAGRRRLKYGANTIVAAAIVLAILALANYVAYRKPKRFDLTEVSLYSLSPQSLKLLSELQEDIYVEAFFQETHRERAGFEDLLKEYQYHSPRFHYQFIDPVKEPFAAQQKGVTEDGTVFITRGERSQRIKGTTEQDVTNALIQVTRGGKKEVCYVTGHGENDIEDTGAQGYSVVREELEKEGRLLETLSLFSVTEVPQECDVVVVSGPKKALLDVERERLKEFFEKGGRILIQLDPYRNGGLAPWLESYGILLEDDMVVDPMARIFSGDYFTPFVANYPKHPITDRFNLATFYPTVRSISYKDELPEEIEITSIARTSDQSWAETDRTVFQYDEEEDPKGPISIAVAVVRKSVEDTEGENEGREGRIVLWGDSDFVNNRYFEYSGNGDLFLNAINWLIEEEDLISIRPKRPEYTPIQMTADQISQILMAIVALPLLCIVFGVGVWFYRRKK